MGKVKRINLIVKGKGLISEMLRIKQNKIERAIESAIDRAEEESIDAENRVLSLIEKFGESTDSSTKINAVINEICVAMDDATEWQTRKQQVERLKKMLNEEVDVITEKDK